MAHNNEQPAIKRCAIYSRSSVEKDNRDPFDSVSAQFMACAGFIGSQAGSCIRPREVADFDFHIIFHPLFR